MGNAALLARAAGHEVSGADTNVYPPMSTVLRDAAITVHQGYDPARLARLSPDLVVIGNAMSRGNAEIEWILESRALRFTSLPAMLHDLVLRGRRNIVVCGTHGKTTTTALAAFLLRANGADPGFLIGGVPVDPPTGSHLGAANSPFVIEGDEYDSAFFDKRSKFIHYAPHVAVLNNLEFDHADIFRDLADVQRTFVHLARIVPRNGWVVMNGDDPNLRALGPMPWTRVVRVGMDGGNDAVIADFSESASGTEFRLVWRGEPWANVRLAIPGLFNARNAAMAAVAAGLTLEAGGSARPASQGDPRQLKLDALPRFRGVRRRQEVVARAGSLTVIEDFGHHPTALAETLRSFRSRYPGALLSAVFEPRSNTARTRVLQDDFARALAGADDVYLGAVNRVEQIAEDERFDGKAVAHELARAGITARLFLTNNDLLASMIENTLPPGGKPRVVVFFTNGSFDGIIDRYTTAVLTAPVSRP
jgi:UDP-N-acetylmuramate: L-alanyl-gamma-D-glutamyl-meso-diaminopimelate ligase